MPGLLNNVVSPRARLIIDNDFGGDPDGLFQLAHHLLSPSLDVRGVIGSHHQAHGFYGSPCTAEHAHAVAGELLDRIPATAPVTRYRAGETGLPDDATPVVTPAAEFIVAEAMRDDTELPLYVACGAGLTAIASAWLIEPRIGRRLRLVWIGGPEHAGLGTAPPGAGPMEYNLGIDPVAAQLVFNRSDLELWQVPRDAYRQALVSHAELNHRLGGVGPLGAFLLDRLADLMQRADRSLGEAYVLGDNPLVLLTALQSSWEADPASSASVIRPAPRVNDRGGYDTHANGRPVRIFTRLDTRLMFEDFYAKIAAADR